MTVMVTAGLTGDDPIAAAELRQHWLDPPSLLPYNLTDTKSYLGMSKGDTWPFIHHYIERLFSGETNSQVKMLDRLTTS